MQLDIDKHKQRLRKARSRFWIGIILIIVGFFVFPYTLPLILIGLFLLRKGVKDRETVVISLKEEILKDTLNEYIEEGYYTPKRKLPKQGKQARNPVFRLIVWILKIPLHALKLFWVFRFQGGPFGLYKHYKVKTMSRINGLTPKEVLNSDFIPIDKAFQSKDFIRGKMSGVHFKASDVRCMRVTTETSGRRYDGKKSKRTVIKSSFHGRLFIFDFNKPLDGRVLALERFQPLNGKIYQDVETESIAFNEKFSTYATDPHLAFYVLTPHKMESLMELEKMHPGQIGFAFIKNRLYVALNTGKDTFPIGKNFQNIDETFTQALEKDLDRLRTLIERLKLDNDMFKQEESITDEDYFQEADELVKDDAEMAAKIAAEMEIQLPATRKERPRLFHTGHSRALYDAHVGNLDKEGWEKFDGLFEKAKEKRRKKAKKRR